MPLLTPLSIWIAHVQFVHLASVSVLVFSGFFFMSHLFLLEGPAQVNHLSCLLRLSSLHLPTLQTGFHRDPPASAYQVQGLKACSTTTRLNLLLCVFVCDMGGGTYMPQCSYGSHGGRSPLSISTFTWVTGPPGHQLIGNSGHQACTAKLPYPLWYLAGLHPPTFFLSWKHC